MTSDFRAAVLHGRRRKMGFRCPTRHPFFQANAIVPNKRGCLLTLFQIRNDLFALTLFQFSTNHRVFVHTQLSSRGPSIHAHKKERAFPCERTTRLCTLMRLFVCAITGASVAEEFSFDAQVDQCAGRLLRAPKKKKLHIFDPSSVRNVRSLGRVSDP